MWLVLFDCYWTAVRRKRHGLQDDAVCVLCSQEEESISHLLLSCVLAREVWHCVPSRLGWQALMPGRRYYYYRNANLFRLGNPFCPDFPSAGTKWGGSFCPECGNRDKKDPLVPVGVTNRDQRSFFFYFLLLNSFSISIILLHFN